MRNEFASNSLWRVWGLNAHQKWIPCERALREFIKGAWSTHEKLKNKADKVAMMKLEEALMKLEDAMVKQDDIRATRAEINSKLLTSKQQKNKSKCSIQKQNTRIFALEIKSKQQKSKSKQQEVKSKLDEVKTRLQIPVTAKDLCWNIHGATGKADIRNCMVPAVVRLVCPDILLVQEKPSEAIVGYCKKIKNYREEESTGSIQSLVLYDADKYKVIHSFLIIKS